MTRCAWRLIREELWALVEQKEAGACCAVTCSSSHGVDTVRALHHPASDNSIPNSCQIVNLNLLRLGIRCFAKGTQYPISNTQYEERHNDPHPGRHRRLRPYLYSEGKEAHR